jgi:hypothetical protein
MYGAKYAISDSEHKSGGVAERLASSHRSRMDSAIFGIPSGADPGAQFSNPEQSSDDTRQKNLVKHRSGSGVDVGLRGTLRGEAEQQEKAQYSKELIPFMHGLELD